MFETSKKNDYQQHIYESKLYNSIFSECFPVNFVLTSSLPSDITSSVIITVANNNCCTGGVNAAR